VVDSDETAAAAVAESVGARGARAKERGGGGGLMEE